MVENDLPCLTVSLSFDLIYQMQIQMTAPLKLSYAEKLHKLESQYSKLLVSLSYIFDVQLFSVRIICEKS